VIRDTYLCKDKYENLEKVPEKGPIKKEMGSSLLEISKHILLDICMREAFDEALVVTTFYGVYIKSAATVLLLFADTFFIELKLNLFFFFISNRNFIKKA
jgi:hypothetical protein